jgi:hypothetical protein
MKYHHKFIRTKWNRDFTCKGVIEKKVNIIADGREDAMMQIHIEAKRIGTVPGTHTVTMIQVLTV